MNIMKKLVYSITTEPLDYLNTESLIEFVNFIKGCQDALDNGYSSGFTGCENNYMLAMNTAIGISYGERYLNAGYLYTIMLHEKFNDKNAFLRFSKMYKDYSKNDNDMKMESLKHFPHIKNLPGDPLWGKKMISIKHYVNERIMDSNKFLTPESIKTLAGNISGFAFMCKYDNIPNDNQFDYYNNFEEWIKNKYGITNNNIHGWEIILFDSAMNEKLALDVYIDLYKEWLKCGRWVFP